MNNAKDRPAEITQKGTPAGRPFFLAVSQIKNTLLDLLYPPRCISCERPMGVSRKWSLCPDCMQMLEFIREPLCCRCGIALLEENESGMCLRCENESDIPAGLTLRSLLRFDGPIQEVLHAVKYRRRLLLWPSGLSAALSELLPDMPCNRMLVTSVPLHENKLKERGFNLPDRIAAELAHKSKLPCRIGLLKRIRETESQVGKTRVERRHNMSGAFALSGRPPDSERLIILVDDVITTGATMAAAAEPFLENGNQVLGISPARAY